MKRIHVRLLVLLAVLILGALAWQADLFRAADCLIEGGRWNWDGAFCRLDRPPV
ncbi:MAG: hypothetical protein ABW164_04270 [Sphingobium sp.]